ncbi:TerB family tellurite resistance protein [Candidatus Woesearchaeota archaeon]|nr:TerB family tellurite resistance protein [Candidatus Woesearchaeota archaeon]
MLILFGARTRISRSSENDVLKNACPSCGSDLELSNLKRWFTLYFIPIFPVSHIDTFYRCVKCKQTYKKEIKDMLNKNKKERQDFQKNAKKNFAVALAACMTHMAKADGKICKEEKEEIKKVTSKFPEFKNDISKAVQKVTKSKDDDDVFKILRSSQKYLTAEGVMLMVAQLAKVLLADGKIDKAEEKLMKDYLLALGLDRNLYSVIIAKAKEIKK